VQYEIFKMNNLFEFIIRIYSGCICCISMRISIEARGCCTKQTAARIRLGKRISWRYRRDLILTVTTIPRVHMKKEKKSIWRDSFIWRRWVEEYTISRDRNNGLDGRAPNINRRVTVLFKDSWIRENDPLVFSSFI